MKSTYTKVAGGLVLALILTQPAIAERGESSYYAPPSFNDLDVSRNGTLDKGEVQGRSPLYGQWDRFDMNLNGLIEPAEFAAFEVMDPLPSAVKPPTLPVPTPEVPAY